MKQTTPPRAQPQGTSAPRRGDANLPPLGADRRQLQQIIAGLTEGVILIDPDQTIAWANETALKLHGVNSMAALGTDVSDYRSKFELTYRNQHKLPVGGYPMERLLAGETFSEVVVEVRNVETRESWTHQLRTLVLTDDAGLPDCLVMIINDETERFNAEERFEQAFNANPAPAVIVRLSDMRYVRVNQGFLELTGFEQGNLIGRSVHDFDVLAGAERRSLAVERLHAGLTIPQMEGCLSLPDGTERVVLLGGQPIEIGDEPCMLFTFADLQPRHVAQHALRHSEERFAKAFNMAPGPMVILALDELQIIDVNVAFTVATGWRREEVVGRNEAELLLWGSGRGRADIVESLHRSGHVRGIDVQGRSKDGTVTDFLLSADTVEINGSACVLSLMLDITERKQTETELLAAVQSVMQDTSWLGQRIVERMATLNRAGRPASNTPEISSLPARVREVLSLIAQGLSDDEIAEQLGISKNTVRNHVSVIYNRLQIRKRSAVIVWARERGLGATAKSRKTTRKKRLPAPT